MDYEKELLHEMLKTLNRLDDNIDQINVTLAKQEGHLAEHIRRTELLEETVKPLQKQANVINGLILLLGGIFAILGAVKAGIEIFKLFF